MNHHAVTNLLVIITISAALTTATVTATDELIKHPVPCQVIQFEPEPDRPSAPVITDLAVQPNGHLIAVVGDDHIVRLCRKESGEVVHKLKGHQDWVRAVAFSPSGQSLVTAGNDRKLIHWDPDSGEKIAEIDTQQNAVTCIRFDPQGRFLATVGFHQHLKVYDLENRRVVQQLDCPCEDMRSIALSPDGSLIAAGGRNGIVRVWKTNEGEFVQDIHAHQRRIRAITFMDNSTTLVTCGEDRKVKIIDLDRPNTPRVLPSGRAKVMAIEIIGPTTLASAGSDNTIRIWNLESLSETKKLVGHQGSVTTLRYNAGKLYSGSFDTQLRIWEIDPRLATRSAAPVPQFGRPPQERSLPLKSPIR